MLCSVLGGVLTGRMGRSTLNSLAFQGGWLGGQRAGDVPPQSLDIAMEPRDLAKRSEVSPSYPPT